MKFKKEMYLKGQIYHQGEYINLSKEQYDVIKSWIEKKSLKTYANLCIHCFNSHGLIWIPYKLIKVFWHTYVDGFYKTIANNEPCDSED